MLCAAAGLIACGGDDDDDSGARSVEEFCQIEIGMTPDEVREVAGEPAEDYTGDLEQSGFEPQMIYLIDGNDYTVFFNTSDDTVRAREITTAAGAHASGDPCTK